MELEGKVALVTGAGSGIGHAIASRFGREGASVVVNYFGSEDEAEALAGELSACCARSIPVRADVSDGVQVRRMFEEAVEALGPVDVLVNNAGISQPAAFLEMDEATWDRTLHVDLKGAFLCAQAAARVMRAHGGGAIINISSIHEDVPFPGFAHYCAAKGGMRMLMRALAPELAPLGIRVNNIAPGAIATRVNRRTMDDPEKMALLRRVVPLGRMGTADEVAEVALFLASERARYVTGSTYYVDGGLARHAEPV
jgi:glucose 1-dehydrogenase